MDENPEEAEFIGVPEVPDDAEVEPWHGLYFRAWEALRFDRFYGALGGETSISYGAISRYASDHGITGDDFASFVHFLQALDAEWLQHLASNAKNRGAGA
ncbi:hypothetical protein [Sinorhizobium meliloti]|uniref:hypothetical protein n=1 Tax=Rhizobium meliloti TaxID=382 RepID=UPI000FDA62B1|nr:hypothetical protein [Sinorhizobium meliloti]MQW24290.1 hypothetical protein [Sinorhizobium meliloti]RVM10874.1 hypothetical protein CN142_17115 [Sinorhizobium meliloti]